MMAIGAPVFLLVAGGASALPAWLVSAGLTLTLPPPGTGLLMALVQAFS